MIHKVIMLYAYQNKGIRYMKSKLNIDILVDEKGKKTRVLMSIKHFKKLMDELENLQDLDLVYKRMSQNNKPIPYEEVMKELLGDVAKK